MLPLSDIDRGDQMEVTIVWSWVSFWLGAVATVTLSFSVLLAAAFSKWSKSRK